jgi:hypothetical protein
MSTGAYIAEAPGWDTKINVGRDPHLYILSTYMEYKTEVSVCMLENRTACAI